MINSGERKTCPRCQEGTFSNAKLKSRVHSNVRAWKTHFATVWQCPNCNSLVSLEKVDLDPFYDAYPISNKKLDGFARQTYKRYADWLRSCGMHSASKVLDYGCSTGLLIEYLRETGIKNVSGFDPYVEEFSDRRVLNEKYDIVVAQDVIEHVEDPCALFSELSTQLAPGGILCIGTPRADAIDLLQFENFIHELHVPYHICILSESALLELGKINNLEIENVHRRLYLDTIVPFINWTFLRSYLRRIDNTLDASFEEPKIGMVARSPRLLFEGLFGYWLPVHTNMLVLFRKTEH